MAIPKALVDNLFIIIIPVALVVLKILHSMLPLPAFGAVLAALIGVLAYLQPKPTTTDPKEVEKQTAEANQAMESLVKEETKKEKAKEKAREKAREGTSSSKHLSRKERAKQSKGKASRPSRAERAQERKWKKTTEPVEFEASDDDSDSDDELDRLVAREQQARENAKRRKK